MKTPKRIYWLRHREAIIILTVGIIVFILFLAAFETGINYIFN